MLLEGIIACGPVRSAVVSALGKLGVRGFDDVACMATNVEAVGEVTDAVFPSASELLNRGELADVLLALWQESQRPAVGVFNLRLRSQAALAPVVQHPFGVQTRDIACAASHSSSPVLPLVTTKAEMKLTGLTMSTSLALVSKDDSNTLPIKSSSASSSKTGDVSAQK